MGRRHRSAEREEPVSVPVVADRVPTLAEAKARLAALKAEIPRHAEAILSQKRLIQRLQATSLERD